MSRSDRAVFRLPGVALIIPFLLFVCVTPLANAGASFWLALYILPVAGLAYILLTRTVADSALIRTSGLLGGRRIPWSDLDGLEFHGPRWAIAVATDGRRVRLPMVRPRDLPRLAQVSGGRLLLGRDAPPQPDVEDEADATETNVAAEPDTTAGTNAPTEDNYSAEHHPAEQSEPAPDSGPAQQDEPAEQVGPVSRVPAAQPVTVPGARTTGAIPADE